ncbi:MAG: hypothetical protein C6W59_08625 [Paenibacillaceae bacterium]|jgi:hypothetical protein|nr:MAG: hypothetical protein C6W59_08625 [Paenibacillaceae bacterium]
MIPPNCLDGVVKELECYEPKPPNIDMRFFYIQLQGGNVRLNDFISAISQGIVSFALSRRDALEINHLNAIQKTKEARERYVISRKSGELGELALYMFLESKEEAPQILSKMSLKTSGNMHVHGSDAVHVKINDAGDIFLFLGESKVYKDIDGSINACLDSIFKFYFDERVEGRTQFDFDLKLVKENMDVDDPELRIFLQDLFNPWKGGKEHLFYVNACFIIFEVPELDKIREFGRNAEEKLLEIYKDKMTEIARSIKQKLDEKNQFGLQFLFFFLPVTNTEEARRKFQTIMGFGE